MRIKNYISIAILVLLLPLPLFGQDKSNKLSIQDAIVRGKIDLVKEMISENPKRVNIKNQDGWSPLFLASWTVNKELVEFLTLNGANVNTSDKNGYTPLHNVIAGADYNEDAYEIVVFLVENGSIINSSSFEGLTPLHWAARSGKANIAEFLIINGANIDAKDNVGDTPLHIASKNGHLSFVEKIMELGGKVEILNNEGSSCLFESVIGGYPEIVQLLIEGGSDYSYCTELNDQSLLHLSSIYGFAEISEYLIDLGMDINQNDRFSNTPIEYAIRYKHRDIVKLLRNKGAKENASEIIQKVSNSLQSKTSKGEAIVYKIWGGWAVKSTNYFTILGYWENKQLPSNLCMANGYINPDEVGKFKSLYFVNRYHPQPGGKKIYDIEEYFNDITYFQHSNIYNKDVDHSLYVSARNTVMISDNKIVPFDQPGGLGYYIEIDSIKIFSPFMNIIENPDESFIEEVDFIAATEGKCDIAFLKINTESKDVQKRSFQGLYYSIDKLKPKIVFLNIDDFELRETTINNLKLEYKDIDFYSYNFPGDHFLVNIKR